MLKKKKQLQPHADDHERGDAADDDAPQDAAPMVTVASAEREGVMLASGSKRTADAASIHEHLRKACAANDEALV
jgi:hypothetical protein